MQLSPVLSVGLTGSLLFASAASAGSVKLLSVGKGGVETDGASSAPSISSNGRFVVFTSTASNIVAPDGNEKADVFVRDLKKRKTTMITRDPVGLESNNQSAHPRISKNGRFIAFESDASNLVAGDTLGHSDVFVHDRKKHVTTRVSVDSSGAEVDGNSIRPSISEDGRFVAFESSATNLVADDTNGKADVFVHDRVTGATTRVSVASNGAEASKGGFDAAISGNGRFVAFTSTTSDLVGSDDNSASDVFIHDRETGVTSLVSRNVLGASGDESSRAPSVSFDGRFIAFASGATDLDANGPGNDDEDIFVRDTVAGTTTCVSVNGGGVLGDLDSRDPEISQNGRYVVFTSLATNLVPGDALGFRDVFVHDRKKHATRRVSVAKGGGDASQPSDEPDVSNSGRRVVFSSLADDLVSGDGNGLGDSFLAERKP